MSDPDDAPAPEVSSHDLSLAADTPSPNGLDGHAPEGASTKTLPDADVVMAHATGLAAAMQRLALRVTEADEALAAVASEVGLFREAQRRFDAVESGRERRRLELEAFRVEVARLAHEILGRVDGLFASEGARAAPPFGEATEGDAAPT